MDVGYWCGIGDPDVRESVGEEDDAVDATLALPARDELATAKPSTAQVRAAAGLDMLHVPRERCLRIARRRLRDGGHLVVVRDDTDDVLGV